MKKKRQKRRLTLDEMGKKHFEIMKFWALLIRIFFLLNSYEKISEKEKKTMERGTCISFEIGSHFFLNGSQFVHRFSLILLYFANIQHLLQSAFSKLNRFGVLKEMFFYRLWNPFCFAMYLAFDSFKICHSIRLLRVF